MAAFQLPRNQAPGNFANSLPLGILEESKLVDKVGPEQFRLGPDGRNDDDSSFLKVNRLTS